MKNYLQNNEKVNPIIFIRNCQSILWKEVFDFLEKKEFSHSLITGNPGIGKSRSMSYFLKLLLLNKKIIIYEARKDQNIFAFVPNGDKEYKFFRCSLLFFDHSSCYALNDEKNYYLIDPKNPFELFQFNAHTILCVSSNIDQYKEFIKRDKTKRWCMPVWKKNELFDVHKYFKINKEIFEQRYFYFGGRIKYIYEEEQNGIWMDIISLIQKLSFETLVEALISVSELDRSYKGISSMLFIYDVVENENGYKYELTVNNCNTIIASLAIKYLISLKYWDKIMNTLNSNNLNNNYIVIGYGNLFQILATTILELGGTFDCKIGSKFSKITLIQAKKIESNSTKLEEYLNFCSKLKPSSETLIREIVYPNSINQPVLDIFVIGHVIGHIK